MSFASEEEVDCLCGETFMARVWNSVNLKEDPELRGHLMGGALNVAPCSLCRGLVYADRFILVHDPENEILAFVHPLSRAPEREFLEARMREDVLAAQATEEGMKVPYPATLFFGINALVDLLNREQESTIQSAIVESLAPSLPVTLQKLPPSRARAAGLPRRLPFAGEGDGLARLKAGLKAVLAANDRLTVYADLLRVVESGGVSLPA